MKWRYGIVKTYPSPKITEMVLCEVYFDSDPLAPVAYTQVGATFSAEVEEGADPFSEIIRSLERARRDCEKYPVFDSATLSSPRS